ncbi:rhomboid-like protein [Rhodococcus koreensis]
MTAPATMPGTARPGIALVSPEHCRAFAIRARRYFTGAPATLVYLFTLLVTWWTMQGTDPSLTHHLIVSASTNLHNMRADPLQVLVASAFWTDSTGFPWLMIAGFLLVMVAAERRLGTRRWIATFAAGHVGATLVTVTGIAWALDHNLLAVNIARTADVGTSYGFYAVAAAFTMQFTGRSRLIWATALIGYLTLAASYGQSFTDYGHLAAIAIGFATHPVATLASRRWARSRLSERAPAI